MNAFVDSLHEVFERLGRIETRRMFGGDGIYHEGRMIALVSGDVLYLKADAESAPHFDKLALPPFPYMRQGKPAHLSSYRQAPADLFEDREEAALWGRRAYEAALRSGHPPRAARAASEKAPAKKTPARKAAAKKTSAKKAPVKRTTSKKKKAAPQ